MFSNRNRWEGEELCSICKEIGLTQLIREPTREEHLLDLVLSSVPVMKTAQGKAKLFADTFAGKCKLPTARTSAQSVTNAWKSKDPLFPVRKTMSGHSREPQ